MYKPSDTPNCESTDTDLFFVPEGQGTYPELKALKKDLRVMCSTKRMP